MNRFLKKLVIAAFAVLGVGSYVSAGPYTITGFQPYINLTGYNTSYTYVPVDSNGNLKPEYANAISKVNPRGFRFMDFNQVVGSQLVNWSDRPTNDLGPNGATYETDMRVANQFHAIPWLNLPDLATDDYAYQLGKLTAQKLDQSIKTVKIERGNEYWNAGAGYQAAANLFRARANPALNQYSDTEKMARQATIDGVARITAFRQGYSDGGGKASVEWEWGGFSANQYWTLWGMDQLQKMGYNPATMKIRLAVANYVEGSPTDVAINTTDSPQVGLQKLEAFVDVNKQWNLANKGMADFYHLLGVDVYEARAGTSGGITQGDMLNWWLNFNKTPQAQDLQHYFWKSETDSVGADSAINIEGLYGIQYSIYGQFSLLDIDQLNSGSPSFNGTIDTIDFSNTVPEPSTVGLVGIVTTLLLKRKSR